MTTRTERAEPGGFAPAPDGVPATGDPGGTPTRAALRYYGGKARLAPWIVAHHRGDNGTE